MSKLQNTFFEKLKEILGDRIRYEINYRPKYLKDVNKTMPYEIDVYVNSEVKLNREALKNLIVRRSKTVLPEKRFKKLIDAIVIQAKIRRHSKRKLSHEDYEIMIESKIQQKMLETGFMPVFS